MGEIIKTTWLKQKDAEGTWSVLYRVRRDDGEELDVQADCTGSAHATAEAQNNAEALEHMREYCGRAAIQAAEASQPPSRRGGVLVRLWFDTLAGASLRKDFDYGDNAGRP